MLLRFCVVVRPVQLARSIKNMVKGSADYFTGECFDVILEILENDGEEMAKEISQAMDSGVNEVIFL